MSEQTEGDIVMGRAETYNKDSIDRARVIFAEVYELLQQLNFDGDAVLEDDYGKIVKNSAYKSIIEAELYVTKALSIFKTFYQEQEEKEAWEEELKRIKNKTT